MRNPSSVSVLVIAVVLAGLSGCKRGAGLGDAGRAGGPPPQVRPGEKLVLWAPPGVPCPVRSASSLADARAGRGTALEGHASVASPLELGVQSVKDGGNSLILQVKQPSGASGWLLLPRGAPALCVHRDVTALRAASERVGKELAFAPWRSECRQIHAAGQAPEALLVDSDAGVKLTATALRLGPANAAELVQNKPGTTVWLRFGDGLLDVRGDTVAGCFVDPADPSAQRPTSVDARLAPGRCGVDPADPRHTTCTSTVATWEGQTSPQSLALQRVWRTLGPLHFYDGHPVDGTRFARTVVAVAIQPPSSEDVRALHSGLSGTVQRTLQAASGGNVRIARRDETEVSHSVSIAVRDVRIGELQRSESTGTSEYQDGYDVRENPKKEPARQRAESARQRVREEADDFDRRKREAQDTKQRLYEECKRQAANIDQQGWRTAASSGCDIGNIAVDVTPSRASLDQAEQERDEAEREYASEPDTIKVPIMRTHTYRKRFFSRNVSATLELTLAAAGQPPRTQRIPVGYAWQDHEVQSEPRYNVTGHTPDRRPIDDGRALLGALGGRIAQVVAGKVKQAVLAAALEDSRRAFLAAGNAPTQPGFEHVDATAFETVERRLERVALRGRAPLAGKAPFQLPTAAAGNLAAEQCLLAIAVAPPGSEHVRLTLRTPNGSHADQRGRPAAALEICGRDLGGARPDVLLESPDNAEVRWALYVTRAAPAPAAAAPAEAAPAAPAPAPAAPTPEPTP